MARKNINWKTKGMNRDISVSAFNPEFSFENRNIRLATNEGNTMMSWVNERGTEKMTLHISKNGFNIQDLGSADYMDHLIGTCIGTAVINHQLVVFTTDSNDDYIYCLWLSKSNETILEGKVLYNGHLGFKVDCPLETLVSYESKDIQKVYWVDGINQPRVINVVYSQDPTLLTDTSFDFVQELSLKENVQVTKIFGSGEFPAGVIQYAFTYYNKHGQESNIFYTTPLQYISYVDRGGSADSKIANSFKIEISGVDGNFDYLRIYSILRTSLNAVPLCKRVQDIEVSSSTLSFIDDGLQGNTIDPTELLYKGGEEITAYTLEQKDNTLFLGNIDVKRKKLDIQDKLLGLSGASRSNPLATKISSIQSSRKFILAAKEPLSYINTLSSNDDNRYLGCSGFKGGEYYRLGVQFQYKNGKWSEPYWIGDAQESNYPRIDSSDNSKMWIPGFSFSILGNDIFQTLWDAGYRKIRPLLAAPKISDRTILCQGVGCPTMYRYIDRYADPSKKEASNNRGRLYAQSSWLFRVPTSFASIYGSRIPNGDSSNGGGKVSYSGELVTQFDYPMSPIRPSVGSNYIMSPYLRDTEVMGYFDPNNSFRIDANIATIHSPDVEFDTSFHNIDFTGCSLNLVGGVPLTHTYGDINIQTSTPPMGSDVAGFIHRSIVTDGAAALISAPFYNDYIVDDYEKDGEIKYNSYHTENPSLYFPVYMWHKNGSLNNDINRVNRSAELLKKVISNYRLGSNTTYNAASSPYNVEDIQLFDSNELAVSKVAGEVYMGNIETMLTPSKPSKHYFIGNPYDSTELLDYFNWDSYCFLALKDPNNTDSQSGVWTWAMKDGYYEFNMPKKEYSEIGNNSKGLCQWREPISMKYKSTSHLVAKLYNSSFSGIFGSNAPNDTMPLVEVVKSYDKETLFGGTSTEAFMGNTWIPCGLPTSFERNSSSRTIYFYWGDTYYQRYECLKTYPFTPEDKNQVVEIASFMVETRVNIDGRYDRNRAQTSNLNMTPQNFNLINPVYSQMDNFFSYKILDEDSYKETSYPNTITWTKTKENGADVDLWTNVTLANTLELDGNKGEITKLTRLNNQLLCFQDSGISQILYNENTQISTTEGVPIEIANSEKVQGKRYLSDTVGCSNKWSMAQTPSGIYFMDSNDKSIYMFNGQLNNISTVGGFNSWAKQNIPSASTQWNPSDFGNFVAYYDKMNQDVLFINAKEALAFSEKFNCFTSFYDYGNTPYFESLDDIGIWIRDGHLWRHQAGSYSQFFGSNKPFSMTLVANQEPQVDKIFTNLEFRACVEGEGTNSDGKFVPLLPFDTLEAWNEYQHGKLSLSIKNKNNKYTHGLSIGILDRKFRVWRCDIPRDNVLPSDSETQMGIKRFKARPLDRIRNPWAYIKLEKNASVNDTTLSKIEVHDIVATYFG